MSTASDRFDLSALFSDFPAPLLLVRDGEGHAEGNRRFHEEYPGALQGWDGWRAALRPDVPTPLASELQTDRGPLPILLRVQRLPSATLMVVEAAPRLGPPDVAQLQRRIQELERLSTTDRLTGAWNRAQFDRVVHSELNRCARDRQALSLLLFDIDHFKVVNDTFGHPVGDEVLRALAQVLRANTRPADALFRWGGEEFVVLAPACGHRHAQPLAERLRRSAEAAPMPHVGQITVSAGVAEHLPGEAPADWFARADASLYAAKHAGRNRVIVDRRGESDAWGGGPAPVVRLTWTDADRCGEPLIDAQHEHLFTLANQLIEAILVGSPEVVGPACRDLADHVARHFADEERLIGARGYPHLGAHRQAHARLLERADDLLVAAGEGRATMGAVVDFLATEVVANHLRVVDRDFYPLFA